MSPRAPHRGPPLKDPADTQPPAEGPQWRGDHHHHHHHQRGHPHRHRAGSGWPGWRWARGVQRRLLLALGLAMAAGLAGGLALHAGFGGPRWLIAVGLGALLTLWPLSWAATFRIAKPLRELARAASALRSGDLRRGRALPKDDGEVGEVAEALDDLSHRLQAQLADQKALLAAVSHELRSPLGRLRLLTELHREGRGGPELADRIDAQVDLMDGLVADLLAAARIDFAAAAPQRLDLRAELRRLLRDRGLLEGALPHGPAAPVLADPTLLRHALTMMLHNAEQHGQGLDTLRLEADEDGVAVTVLDRGPGFGAGEAEQAFAPFWRGPDGRGAGSGLGLALVRRIAEQHGGAAGAHNRAEGGAAVWLRLPSAGGLSRGGSAPAR